MFLLTVVLASLAISVGAPAVSMDRPSAVCADQSFDGQSFAVYVLSIGRGVPEETYETYQSVKSQLQQMRDQKLVSLLLESRIGIEGERRLCVAFTDATVARNTWIDVCETLLDVPLINLEIEECKQD